MLKFIISILISIHISFSIIYTDSGVESIFRRTQSILNLSPESLANFQFYNKEGLARVLDMIFAHLAGSKSAPLVILIDGDCRVGKTTLAKNVTEFFQKYGISTATVHMDEFLNNEELPLEFIAYQERYGPTNIFDLDPLTGRTDSWDYRGAAQKVSGMIGSAEFDIVILEGLNSGYLDILDYCDFDIRIHVEADEDTRKHIYALTFPDRLDKMEQYLERYRTKHKIGDIAYDLIIDNSIPD